MRIATFITLLFYCAIANFNLAIAQESNAQLASEGKESQSIEGVALLKKAKNLRSSNLTASISFANEALQVAKTNNDAILLAESHVLLSKLTYQNKDKEASLNHFSLACVYFNESKDNRQKIRYTINYIDILLKDKRFDLAERIGKELLPVSLFHGDNTLIALTMIINGDVLYKKQQYALAIKEYIVAKQYLTKDDKETLKHLGETNKMIAQAYKRLKNREQTAIYYKKALDVYIALDNKALMARTLSALAEAERYLGNVVTALEYSNQALALYADLDKPEEQAKALMVTGIIYRHIGRYEKSLEHIHQAHLYYRKVNNMEGIATTSNQIGLIYTRLQQFDQAKSFYQLTISLPEEKIAPKTLASAVREMAIINLESGDYVSAKIMAFKAKKIYRSIKDKLKESLVARIIGNINRAQENYSEAITSYHESIAIAKEIDNKVYKIKAQTPLGGILLETKPDEAIILLLDSLSVARQLNIKTEILYALRNLHRAEKKRKNYKASLEYAEQEMALNKMIQDEKDEKDLTRTKANLHSYKMEVELASLREKAKLDQLEIAKKSNEIEIAEQHNQISELQLTKNKYSNIALASLLAVCLVCVAYIYRRFTDSKKRNKELNFLASRDSLTNCYNRRSLFEYLEREFAKNTHNDEYSIIMADIDLFKSVNDNYGHNVGDEVLCGVAKIIQESVRQNDIAARFGGEEFCVILAGSGQAQSTRIAEIIRTKIEDYQFTHNIKVTCSFGVTSSNFGAEHPTELINQADLALYRSKALGRNQVTLWNHSL